MTTVAPLLFLVILKIADVGREMSLTEVYGNRDWHFVDLYFLNTEDWMLGKFGYIHSVNNSIAFLTYIGTAYSFEGSLWLVIRRLEGDVTVALIGLVTLIVWVLLPLMEVSEYSTIISDDKEGHLQSFANHVGSVVWATVFASITAWLLPKVWAAEQGTLESGGLGLSILVSTILMIWFVFRGTNRFLSALEEEIEGSTD